jgi:hypothetical protein
LVFLYLYVGYSSECGDCWPLDPHRKAFIVHNYPQLVELLDTDEDLIVAIRSRGCFNDALLQSIESSADLRERARKLLDIVLRNSVSKLNQFIECLNTTQPHLVPLLTGNLGILSLGRDRFSQIKTGSSDLMVG